MLKCISRYSSSLGAFAPGDVVTVPALAAALLADSPGSFALIDQAAQDVQEVRQADAAPEAAQPVPVVQKPARAYRRKG